MARSPQGIFMDSRTNPTTGVVRGFLEFSVSFVFYCGCWFVHEGLWSFIIPSCAVSVSSSVVRPGDVLPSQTGCLTSMKARGSCFPLFAPKAVPKRELLPCCLCLSGLPYWINPLQFSRSSPSWQLQAVSPWGWIQDTSEWEAVCFMWTHPLSMGQTLVSGVEERAKGCEWDRHGRWLSTSCDLGQVTWPFSLSLSLLKRE